MKRWAPRNRASGIGQMERIISCRRRQIIVCSSTGRWLFISGTASVPIASCRCRCPRPTPAYCCTGYKNLFLISTPFCCWAGHSADILAHLISPQSAHFQWPAGPERRVDRITFIALVTWSGHHTSHVLLRHFSRFGGYWTALYVGIRGCPHSHTLAYWHVFFVRRRNRLFRFGHPN